MAKYGIKYESLITGVWSREFYNKKEAEEFKGNPDDPSLIIGILLVQLREMREIKKLLSKRKK